MTIKINVPCKNIQHSALNGGCAGAPPELWMTDGVVVSTEPWTALTEAAGGCYVSK